LSTRSRTVAISIAQVRGVSSVEAIVSERRGFRATRVFGPGEPKYRGASEAGPPGLPQTPGQAAVSRADQSADAARSRPQGSGRRGILLAQAR
jgi:hypothetical protein